MLQKQGLQQRYGLEINSHPVCQTSFRLLLGLGKSRISRLRAALLNGESDCPVDLRTLPKKHSRIPSDVGAYAKCVEYLQQLYHTAAEPLPEAMQQTLQITDVKVKRIRRRGKRRQLVKREPAGSGYGGKVKFLPPGSISHYLEMCQTEHPDVKITRQTFTKARPDNQILFFVNIFL